MQVLHVSCVALFFGLGFAAPNLIDKVGNGVIRVKRSVSIPDEATLFPFAKNDKTKINWAHSVTSRAKLQEALKGNAHFIETDILLGTLIGEEDSGKPLLITAHPPASSSDLSLEEFFDTVLGYTQSPKGIKLDFKMLDAVEPALEMLKKRENKIKVPVWINADIINGPVDATGRPIDDSTFLHLCQKHFPTAVLSLGWTTRFGPELTNPLKVISKGSYTQAHVENMQAALISANITQPVTFPVRAGIAASLESHETLLWLLEKVPGSTLTIWSSPYDPVDDVSLVKLLNTVGRYRVYLDVPKGLRCLVNSGSSSSAPAFNLCPLAVILAFLITLF